MSIFRNNDEDLIDGIDVKKTVFTSVSADEIHIGDKGIFSDSLEDLKYKMERPSRNMAYISQICSESSDKRFRRADNGKLYNLFFLIERKEDFQYTIKEIKNILKYSLDKHFSLEKTLEMFEEYGSKR